MNLYVRIAILITALLCIGCLDYEQTLVINKDGSGTIKMHYAIDKSFLEMGQSMTAGLEDESETATMDKSLAKERVESNLAASDWGIKLIDYATSETDESQIWDMTFSFADVNNLWGVYAILNTEDDEDTLETEMPESIFSKQQDGTWLYRFPLTGFDDAEESEDMSGYDYFEPPDRSDEDDMEFTEMSPEQMKAMGMSDSMIQAMQAMQQMASKMSEHVIRFKVTLPGDIVESNAKTVDGNTAVWEFGLTEMDADSLVLRAVMKP